MDIVDWKHAEFKKHYDSWGNYHWRWYKTKSNYRKYVDFLKEWVKEKNTLEVGAGDGLIVSLLNIKGVDREIAGVNFAREKGADVVVGDATKLPFKDEEFEAVLIANTFEHLDHPKESIQEARRVLSKYLYLVVPPKENGKFRMTKEKLKSFVENIGFKEIEAITINDEFGGKFQKI